MLHRSLTQFAGVVAGLGLAFAAGSASAADVVYQSVPDLMEATNSYWCSDCYGGGTYQPLDPFSLSSDASIGSFDLAAYNGAGYDPLSTITFEIYNADHSAIVFSQLVSPTFVAANNTNTTVVHGELTGLDLAAGDYWFGVVGSTYGIAGLSGGNGGLIETTPHTGVKQLDLGGNAGYVLYASETGAVPEPATWALMIGGFGLAGSALRRRRTAVA